MDSEYTVERTSRDSARVPDTVLTSSPDGEPMRNRRVLRTLLVNNIHNAEASVKCWLMHQRRHSGDEPWRDADYFDLRRLPAGEQIRIELDSEETLRLFRTLSDLYAATREGVPEHQARLRVVDANDAYIAEGRERDIIRRLVDQGETFWNALEELTPDVLEGIALAKLHRSRVEAASEFEQELEAARWSEGDWEAFFRSNKWIFGHGLAYQFLNEVQGQPHYGGTAVDRSGGIRGDFLMATEARVRFTVLVDIKKPNTSLLEGEYRNRAYAMSREMVGGVVQLQAQCASWSEESQRPANRDVLESEGVFTCDPKGILVIGHTSELTDRDRRSSFERFRRNLSNPEVLTFDELLARAKFLLAEPEGRGVR